MAKAILYDTTKCTACRACQVACKGWNELPAEVTTNRGTYENPADLSPMTWLKMEFREAAPGGKIRWFFTRRSCMHCTDAGCVKVCPSKALYHHESGFVAYNKDLCTGCGYCIEACPFDVPRSDRNLLTGIAKMDKCTFCTTPGLDRIAEGWEPACVKTCPTNALRYDDRDKLVAEGKKQVDSLRAEGWVNASLYGENELDGLHVMYVLDDHPSVYGLPANPKVSAATVAWQDAIQPLGWAVGGLTVLGLGLNYMVARANINREKEKKDVAGS